jgi:hypothetical protein
MLEIDIKEYSATVRGISIMDTTETYIIVDRTRQRAVPVTKEEFDYVEAGLRESRIGWRRSRLSFSISLSGRGESCGIMKQEEMQGVKLIKVHVRCIPRLLDILT